MSNNFDDYTIDLKEIFTILWNKKKIIIGITLFFAIFSVIFALSLPNIYTSKATLAEVNPDESLSSQLNSLTNIATISGVNLPERKVGKSDEAIKRIKSLEFFSEFFLPNINLEDIMAVDRWEPKNNILIYDSSKFNSETGKWIRNVSFPRKVKPSDQEAFEAYEKILSISKDRKTGFISLSIDHKSPIIAQKWVEIIIYNINDSMRNLDKKIAQNSINYLNSFSKTTNIQSLKDATSNLLESQMRSLMLAESSDEYVLKVIDSPVVPELKSAPSRATVCILITFFGGILSLVYVLSAHFYRLNG